MGKEHNRQMKPMMKPAKTTRRYTKGADHPTRTAEAEVVRSTPAQFSSPPSHCMKCGGPLGVRSALTTKGKVLEWHCPLCGKTGVLAVADSGYEIQPVKYNSYNFLGPLHSRKFF